MPSLSKSMKKYSELLSFINEKHNWYLIINVFGESNQWCWWKQRSAHFPVWLTARERFFFILLLVPTDPCFPCKRRLRKLFDYSMLWGKAIEVFQDCFRITLHIVYKDSELIKPTRRLNNRLSAAFPKSAITVPFPSLVVYYRKITNFTRITRLRTIHPIFATDAIVLKGFTHFGFVQKRMIYHFQSSICPGTTVPRDAYLCLSHSG